MKVREKFTESKLDIYKKEVQMAWLATTMTVNQNWPLIVPPADDRSVLHLTYFRLHKHALSLPCLLTTRQGPIAQNIEKTLLLQRSQLGEAGRFCGNERWQSLQVNVANPLAQ